MHVEGVAARSARRPPGPCQRVPRHDRAVAVEQRGGEPRLDRRQRHPPVAEAQHAVVVEGRAPGPPAPRSAAGAPPPGPAGRRRRRARGSSPRGRRGRPAAAPRRPRAAAGGAGPPVGSSSRRAASDGPANEHDIHGGDRKEGTFRGCFAPVKRSRAADRQRSQARAAICTYAAPPWLASRISTTSHRSPCSRRARRRSCKRWRGRPTRSPSPPARPSASRARSVARPSSSSSGTAEVRRNKKKVATIGPGTCVGELALLDHGPRTASVIAATDLTVLVIGAREFAGIVDEIPSIAHKLLKSLAAEGPGARHPGLRLTVRGAPAPNHYVRSVKLKPHQLAIASARCSPRSSSSRGSPPPLAQWHDDSRRAARGVRQHPERVEARLLHGAPGPRPLRGGAVQPAGAQLGARRARQPQDHHQERRPPPQGLPRRRLHADPAARSRRRDHAQPHLLLVPDPPRRHHGARRSTTSCRSRPSSSTATCTGATRPSATAPGSCSSSA